MRMSTAREAFRWAAADLQRGGRMFRRWRTLGTFTLFVTF